LWSTNTSWKYQTAGRRRRAARHRLGPEIGIERLAEGGDVGEQDAEHGDPADEVECDDALARARRLVGCVPGQSQIRLLGLGCAWTS
jgi:hypothetical protein